MKLFRSDKAMLWVALWADFEARKWERMAHLFGSAP